MSPKTEPKVLYQLCYLHLATKIMLTESQDQVTSVSKEYLIVSMDLSVLYFVCIQQNVTSRYFPLLYFWHFQYSRDQGVSKDK
jgi:hypothetical protein